jgi:ribosomal protein L44E
MRQWTDHIGGYTPQEVQTYCVQCDEWQVFRISLKGRPTEQKLEYLQKWYNSMVDRWPRRTKVQVDNYINALKRGGQLALDGTVQR